MFSRICKGVTGTLGKRAFGATICNKYGALDLFWTEIVAQRGQMKEDVFFFVAASKRAGTTGISSVS